MNWVLKAIIESLSSNFETKICPQAESKEFRRMSQNTVPPSSKFTLKSKDSAKLPGGLTSVYRSFKEPKVRSWIKRRTRGSAAHPWGRHCCLKLQNQMARLPKKLAHNSCQKAPNLEINGKRGRFLKAR